MNQRRFLIVPIILFLTSSFCSCSSYEIIKVWETETTLSSKAIGSTLQPQSTTSFDELLSPNSSKKQ